MSEFQTIRFASAGGVARLTLNRPERRNALNPEMLREILQVLAQVRRDRELRVLVLTGAGSAFCGGVDLNTPFFMENVESYSAFEGARLLDWQHEMITGLYELPQVTIAQVNGLAVGGGGFGMAMACDMRFALKDARFWMIPMAVAVVQDFGLTWFLQRTCGLPRTLEMVISGEAVDAAQGEAWGFINRTFADPAALAAHVDKLAATIAAGAPDAVRLLKQTVRHGAVSPLREQLQVEAVTNGLCFQSREFRDAKARYVERLKRR